MELLIEASLRKMYIFVFFSSSKLKLNLCVGELTTLYQIYLY